MLPEAIDIAGLAWRIYTENEEKIQALEKKRRGHILFLAGFCLLPAALFTLPCRLVEASVDGGGIPLFVLFLLVYAATLFCFGLGFDNLYRRKIKRDLMAIIADGAGLDYRYGGVMTLASLQDHLILPPYASHKLEEGFSGRYRNRKIEFQDFSLLTPRDMQLFDIPAQNRTSLIRGVVMRIALERPLEHHTVLLPSSWTSLLMKQSSNMKFIALNPVNLVFNRFTRHYTVLSTSQIEARVVLDPAMMERLIDLARHLNARWLGVSFRDREMAVCAQYGRNFFEIGRLLKPLNALTITEALEDILRFRVIADVLELREKAG